MRGEGARFDAGAAKKHVVRHFAEGQPAAKAGIGKTVGRPITRPSVLVNSRLVTGRGAMALTGPLKGGCGKRELNHAHQIIERDPAHILPAAADDAAELRAGTASAFSRGRRHSRRGRTRFAS